MRTKNGIDIAGSIFITGDREKEFQIIAFNHLKQLESLGWEIVSLGSITEDLTGHGMNPCEIRRPKGFPRRLNGYNVPNSEIVSGLIANPNSPKDNAKLFDHELGHFDIFFLNIVDSRSFVHHKSHSGINDINVSMFTYLLSAVQNSENVTIITDSRDLISVTREIQENGETSALTRATLAMKALVQLAANLKFVADIAARNAQNGGPIYSTPANTDMASV